MEVCSGILDFCEHETYPLEPAFHSLPPPPQEDRRLSSAWESYLAGKSPQRHVTVFKGLKSWHVAEGIGASFSEDRGVSSYGRGAVCNSG